MLRHILGRIVQAVPLVFLVVIFNFMLIHFARGDPVFLLGGDYVTPEYYAILTERWGLDKPIYVQLYVYLGNIIRGDLGFSYAFQTPVFDLIMSRIPSTILLMGSSLLFSSLFGILLGTVSSRKPYSIADSLTSIASVIGYSAPIFWLGQILIIIFAINLHLFPSGGMSSARLSLQGIELLIDILWHLVLPAATLGIAQLALLTRMTRASNYSSCKGPPLEDRYVQTRI